MALPRAVSVLCGGVLADAFEHLGQRGLIHCPNPVLPSSPQQPGYGRLIEGKPVALGCKIDVAQTDLLGRKLEAGTAVRSLALFDEALLVQQQKAPADHHRTLGELAGDFSGGMHGFRLRCEHGEDSEAETESAALRHAVSKLPQRSRHRL